MGSASLLELELLVSIRDFHPSKKKIDKRWCAHSYHRCGRLLGGGCQGICSLRLQRNRDSYLAFNSIATNHLATRRKQELMAYKQKIWKQPPPVMPNDGSVWRLTKLLRKGGQIQEKMDHVKAKMGWFTLRRKGLRFLLGSRASPKCHIESRIFSSTLEAGRCRHDRQTVYRSIATIRLQIDKLFIQSVDNNGRHYPRQAWRYCWWSISPFRRTAWFPSKLIGWLPAILG